MMTTTVVPSRPALRYYGAKWNVAMWIIGHFPPHIHYIEPCGGGASVLLRKPRSKFETYNDLDGRVVNFFRVLRDQPGDLIYRIGLTPYARAEYELSKLPCDDPVEQARRFWVGCNMSIANMADTSSGWRVTKTIFPGKSDAKTLGDIGNLIAVASRLKGVQIENRSYEEVIATFDGSDSLIYMDPPYVAGTRSTKRLYKYEWDAMEHKAAAALLRQCKGPVIVSGYRCELYDSLYDGWQRVDKETYTLRGTKRVESIWLSPNVPSILQGTLF